MARKQPTSIDEQIEHYRNAPGVVSITVKPPASLDWSDLAGPSRQKGKRTMPVADAKLAERIGERPTDATVFTAIDVRTPNPCNTGGRLRTRLAGKVQQKNATAEALEPFAAMRDELAKGCVVTLRRISRGRLDPIDGLGPSLKHVRDAVAQFLLGGKSGELDESPLITWVLEQEKMGNAFGVIVTIRKRASS